MSMETSENKVCFNLAPYCFTTGLLNLGLGGKVAKRGIHKWEYSKFNVSFVLNVIINTGLCFSAITVRFCLVLSFYYFKLIY